MYKELLNVEENINNSQKDTLTPYKIAVILLIKCYCSTNVKTICERRDFCVIILKLIQTPDMEIDTLLTELHSPNHVLQCFAKELESECVHVCNTGIEGLSELFDVLTKFMKSSLDHSLTPHLLCRNSVLGLYVRRIIVFFEQLSFSDVAQLYDAFVKDFDQSIILVSNWKNRRVKEVPAKKNKNNIWDGRRAELLVAQQAHILQTNEYKAMSPSKLQSLVRELLSYNSYYAEVHYLSYLNCLRVNEYCGALDSLYHCFDRLAPLDNRTVSEDRSRIFRYAALNLAALHAQFDHKIVAQTALKEAIIMAQEAGDNVCLQLAHAWTYYLLSKNKAHLIERSIGKSGIFGITHTMSLGLIASAHHATLEANSPTYVFDTLMKSDVLNYQHSMSDLMSMTYAEKSALWAYYGKAKISTICAQLLLLHNSQNYKQNLFNGESTCQEVISIANALVEVGQYKLADVVFNHAKDRFNNLTSNKTWILSERLFEFTRIMRHENWSEAENIAIQISSLCPFESKLRLAEIALAAGDYLVGLQFLHNVEKNKNFTARNLVQSMNIISKIINLSSTPEQGFTSINSIVLLNSALDIAKTNHLSYYEAIIKINLATVQLVNGMPIQALALIDEAVEQILAHGSWYDGGCAFTLYAQCLVATAPFASKKRKVILQNAIQYLLKADYYFRKIEAFGKIKKTMYFLILLYNELDMKIERNRCAFEYRQNNGEGLIKSSINTLF
ncbi:anaphase-promoting complex subunit 5 [Microplitis mediator]|uniref:anaphase-promoting complex subunit 5 n=1 Tax=Microplitis mediator TaxID=375433 RepID=UPI00255281FF|nr:anaphase-promoting complex subunit 5 [Microplitis mediator]